MNLFFQFVEPEGEIVPPQKTWEQRSTIKRENMKGMLQTYLPRRCEEGSKSSVVDKRGHVYAAIVEDAVLP